MFSQWVGSIDMSENKDADLNILVEKDADLVQQVCCEIDILSLC